MRTVTLALLALFLPAISFAQPCPTAIPDPVPRDAVRLSWTAPTQNTDGSSITKAITYTVYEGTVAKCTTAATAGSLTGLSVGAHSWALTAKTSDGESAKTATVSKTIPAAPPNPPTNLLVDPASLTAYSPIKTKNTLSLLAVGSVALGTSCDFTQGVVKDGVTYYVVPATSVTPQNAGATALVAKCS
jgi:hypothetical protein